MGETDMAGMMPNKKTPEEIESDFKTLLEKHNAAVTGWVNLRLERAAQPEDTGRTKLKKVG